MKGAVLVFPLTGEEGRFAVGAEAFLSARPEGDARMRRVTVTEARHHKGRRLLVLDGIADRTTAEQRAGWYLVIPFDRAAEAREDDEFFIHALPGRAVRTAAGEELGEVLDVIETAGGALLEIGHAGEAPRLLPFARAFVERVTDDEVIVSPPEGWEEL